jgi:hypothetical protein
MPITRSMGDIERATASAGYGHMRVPSLPFDGKDEAWTAWKLRFTSWMKLIGVYDVMAGTIAQPSSTDANAAADYRVRNSTAYTLIITNVSSVAFNAVAQAAEDDGNAAWELLLNRYETKTRANKISLLGELMRVTLQPSQDPEELFTQINGIVKQLSYWENLRTIDDDWLIGVVINALPTTYAELSTVLDNAERLTYNDAKNKIRSFYTRRIVATPREADEEAAFFANITCFTCKKKGHKASQCPCKTATAQAKWCNLHKTAAHSDRECRAQHGAVAATESTGDSCNVGF